MSPAVSNAALPPAHPSRAERRRRSPADPASRSSSSSHLDVDDRVVGEERDSLDEVSRARGLRRVRSSVTRSVALVDGRADDARRVLTDRRPVAPAREVVLLAVQVAPVVRRPTAVVERVGALADEREEVQSVAAREQFAALARRSASERMLAVGGVVAERVERRLDAPDARDCGCSSMARFSSRRFGLRWPRSRA